MSDSKQAIRQEQYDARHARPSEPAAAPIETPETETPATVVDSPRSEPTPQTEPSAPPAKPKRRRRHEVMLRH